MIGSIIFFIIKIKPDIVFAIFFISQFAKNLNYQYIKIIKIIFKYLKGLKHWGITYKKNEKLLFKLRLGK